MVELMIIGVLIGLIPASIARSKGRNFFLWWGYGAAIWIIAFPHSVLLTRDRKMCVYCEAIIDADAIHSKICGRKCPGSA